MNTEEAKLILACLRDTDHLSAESGQDQAAALALLDHDRELKNWFEEERAFDRAISTKLSQIDPPADLKASLVSLPGDRGAQATPPEGRITWFRRPQFLAAAAAVVLLPIIAIQLLTSPANAESFEQFRDDMVKMASTQFELDHKNEHLPKIYAWLEQNNATCPVEIPECIGCEKSIGCKIIDWGDEKTVTLICLRNKTEQVVHCFVIPRDRFDELPSEDRLRQTFTLADLETCGWSDHKNVYLLVGSTEGVKVKAPSSLARQ